MKQLQAIGIQPDILILRTEKDIPASMRRKVAQFCNVAPEAVIQSIDASSIYKVPLLMHAQHLDNLVLDLVGVEHESEQDHAAWNDFLTRLDSATEVVSIGLVGK